VRRVLAAAAMALAVIPAAAASAGSGVKHTETETSGTVTATVSWRGNYAETRNFRIAIDRGGARALDEKIRIEDCPSGGSPGFACPWPPPGNALALADLEGDGEPEAVVAAFTGGAHCCLVAVVYRWNGTGYVAAEHNFFDAFYEVRDLDHDGRFEFDSLDARFGYAFGSFAESVFPVYVVRFDRGGFHDVTAEFPSAIRQDLRRVRPEYRRRADTRHQFGVRAALAAYVADLWRLDRKAEANKVLRRALRRGEIDNQPRQGAGPCDRRYIRKLKRLLRRLGYA
jgi:hypothetical protein